MASGCRSDVQRSGAATSTSTGVESLPCPFPSCPREVIVAEADRLAAGAARKSGVQAYELQERAAELRERLWRRDGREVDRGEALELHRAAAEREPAPRCRAATRRWLLEAEGGDWGGACAGLASLKQKPGCDSEVTPASSLLAPACASALPVTPMEAQGGAATLQSIQLYGETDAVRLVLQLSSQPTYTTHYLPKSDGRGPRLVIDLSGTSYGGLAEQSGLGLVQLVRVGQDRPELRVVADLSRDAAVRVFSIPSPPRIVVDLRAGDGTLAEKRELKRIVLDPGHGGHDPGAIGSGGLREKDVTLDVAHRAAPLLARQLGITALLTRDGDTFIPLDERTARANAFRADLFVSLHCNASLSEAAHGFMTFVLDESGDQLSRRMAEVENQASGASGEEWLRGVLPGVGARSRERSLHFAQLLQRSAASSLERHQPADRGVRRAGFFVLAGAEMPAVLFEMGFISNVEGENSFNTPAFRQRLADAVVNAVRAYQAGY